MATEVLYWDTFNGTPNVAMRGNRVENVDTAWDWYPAYGRYATLRSALSDGVYRNNDMPQRAPMPHGGGILRANATSRPFTLRLVDQVVVNRPSGGSGTCQWTWGIYADFPASSAGLQWPEGLVGFGARAPGTQAAANIRALVSDNVTDAPSLLLDVDLGVSDNLVRHLELVFDGETGLISWRVDGVTRHQAVMPTGGGFADIGGQGMSVGPTLGAAAPSGTQIDLYCDVLGRGGMILLER